MLKRPPSSAQKANPRQKRIKKPPYPVEEAAEDGLITSRVERSGGPGHRLSPAVSSFLWGETELWMPA